MSSDLPVWLKEENNGVSLALYIQPGAKKEGVVGVYGDKLKISLQARPIEGQANKGVIAFLSKRLGIPKNKIRIVSGELSRNKRVEAETSTQNVLKTLSV